MGLETQANQVILKKRYKAIANSPKQDLEKIFSLIDNKVDMPCSIQILPNSSVIKINRNPIQRLIATPSNDMENYINESIYPFLDGSVCEFSDAYLNLFDGSVTGNIDVSSAPSNNTFGYCRWLAVYLLPTGQIKINFSNEYPSFFDFDYIEAEFGIPEIAKILGYFYLINNSNNAWNYSINIQNSFLTNDRGNYDLNEFVKPKKFQECFVLASNQLVFNITKFRVIKELIKCYHVETGQVYVDGGGMNVIGQQIIFDMPGFDYVNLNEIATLVFEQDFKKVTRIVH